MTLSYRGGEAKSKLKKALDEFKRLSKAEQLQSIEKSANRGKMVFTYLHIKEVQRLEGEQTGGSICEYHDVDKLFLYLNYPLPDVSKIHQALNHHHDAQNREQRVMLEKVYDYESARRTKPLKPLNAYDFVIHTKEGGERVGLLQAIDILGFPKEVEQGSVITVEEYSTLVSKVTNEEIWQELNRGLAKMLELCGEGEL